jgi:hypothetical protein
MNTYSLFSLLLPFAWHFCSLVLPHLSVCVSFSYYFYYTWPIYH